MLFGKKLLEALLELQKVHPEVDTLLENTVWGEGPQQYSIEEAIYMASTNIGGNFSFHLYGRDIFLDVFTQNKYEELAAQFGY